MEKGLGNPEFDQDIRKASLRIVPDRIQTQMLPNDSSLTETL